MALIKRVLWLVALLALASPAFAQFGSNALKLRGWNICNPLSPSANQVLTWDGTNNCWKSAAGGGGGGTPAGATGTFQYNNAGSFGGQAFVLGGTGPKQAAVECSTISSTSSDFSGIAATTGEVGSLTIPANAIYIGESIAVEGTTFAFSGANTSTLKFCLERSGGGGTACDVRQQISMKQATGNQSNDLLTNPVQTLYTLKIGAVSSSELLNTLNAGAFTITACYVPVR